MLVAGFAAGEERAVFERIEPVGEDAAIEGPGITRFAETGDEFEVRERGFAGQRDGPPELFADRTGRERDRLQERDDLRQVGVQPGFLGEGGDIEGEADVGVVTVGEQVERGLDRGDDRGVPWALLEERGDRDRKVAESGGITQAEQCVAKEAAGVIAGEAAAGAADEHDGFGMELFGDIEGFDRIGHGIAGAEFVGIDEGAAEPEGADGKRMLLQEVDRLVFAVILELVVPGRHRGDASGAVVQDVILEGPVPGGHLADGQPVETEVDRPREGNGRGRDNRPGI